MNRREICLPMSNGGGSLLLMRPFSHNSHSNQRSLQRRGLKPAVRAPERGGERLGRASASTTALQPSWHPLVSEVLRSLTRPSGGLTVDEQAELAARTAALAPRENDMVLNQLTAISRRLQAAGETTAANVVRSVGALAAHVAVATSVEQRVFGLPVATRPTRPLGRRPKPRK